MKTIIAVTAGLFCIMNSYGQTTDILWEHSYGGSNPDDGTSICQTTDGGYIAVSSTLSTDGEVSGGYGLGDYWVTRLDANGTIQWQKSYGGSGSEAPVIIQYCADGGSIIGGVTNSNDGDLSNTVAKGQQDVWLLKLDSTGNITWQLRIGGSSMEYLYDLQKTTDGGYIITGETLSDDGDFAGADINGDAFVAKITGAGSMSWLKTYGGSKEDAGTGIAQTLTGSYIFCGNTRSDDGQVSGYHGGTGNDAWVVNIDDTGAIIWAHCYGGDDDDQAGKIIVASDKNYIFYGGTYSNNSGDVSANHGNKDLWVVKLDELGVVQWSKNYGGSEGEEYASIVNAADRHGYIISGSSASTDGDILHNKGNDDLFAAKIDDTGSVVWEKNYGGSNLDEGNCMIQTADSCIVLAGFTMSTDGDIDSSFGNGDCWILKLKEAPLEAVTEVDRSDNILVYPTMSNGVVHVDLPATYLHASIRLVSMGGQVCTVKDVTSNTNHTLYLDRLSNGMYLLEVINGNKMSYYKIMYQHPL